MVSTIIKHHNLLFQINRILQQQSKQSIMNSLLARNFSKGTASIARSFSGGSIPTSSTVQSGAYKVVGLDHLSVSCQSSRQYATSSNIYPHLVIYMNCLLAFVIDACYESSVQEEDMVERSSYVPSHRLSRRSYGFVLWLRALLSINRSRCTD